MRTLILLMSLTACAAEPPFSSRDQERLGQELADRVAGEPRSCVSTQQQQSLQIVDAQTLVYRQGATTWVNRLDYPCPGLRPLNTLIVEVHGSQYCRGDLVRGLDPGSRIPGPHCRIGAFTPYRRPR